MITLCYLEKKATATNTLHTARDSRINLRVRWNSACYICLLFIGLSTTSFLFSYEDPELMRLWASLSDIYHPSKKDYLQIETYLREGERPYLNPLRQTANQMDENTKRRLNNIVNFKLLGPNQEMPRFEIHHLNSKEETQKRCILLFASFNGIYPQKIDQILEELNGCNYSGDVLVRIGGFPNLQKGGLKICHIPYAFKLAFLQEAKELGYNEVLWVDTCMHPVNNLERIFTKIKTKGYFFTYGGTLQDNPNHNLLEAAAALDITPEYYSKIKHISSGILGMHMDNLKTLQLLDGWFTETEKVYPAITWFPEELSLSVVAWKLGCKADSWLGMVMCGHEEFKTLSSMPPTLHFYCEDSR